MANRTVVRQVMRYMQDNVEDATDESGCVSPTKLGEIADAKFNISKAPDYVIPEWVWEIAVQVAERAERDNANG